MWDWTGARDVAVTSDDVGGSTTWRRPMRRHTCGSFPGLPKVIVIGLDSAPPELVFDEFAPLLPNITKLRNGGVSGPLRTIEPPITVPAWACMMTSRSPGHLGIYGFRNRKDHTYDGLSFVSSRSVTDAAVWDVLSEAGKKSAVVGVPPSYPPQPLNGWRVSCFLT